jgi:F0F1-type ATP synthase epsilon subunit
VPEPLHLVVWTPSETRLDLEPLDWVHVELADERSLTIWPGHLPMMGQTVPAAVRYADAEGEHEIELPPGIVQVEGGTVTVFLSGEAGEGAAGPVRFDRLSEAMVTAAGRRSAGMGHESG